MKLNTVLELIVENGVYFLIKRQKIKKEIMQYQFSIQLDQHWLRAESLSKIHSLYQVAYHINMIQFILMFSNARFGIFL